MNATLHRNSCCSDPIPSECKKRLNDQRVEPAYDLQGIHAEEWTGECDAVPSALQQGQVLHVRAYFPSMMSDHAIIVYEADTEGNVCVYDPYYCTPTGLCDWIYNMYDNGGIWGAAWILRNS